VVVGQPYRVGDTLFTPVSGMNFDSVGYASVGGPNVGVSAAHHTLPLPCYVEVTSLASGARSWCGWNGAGRWTAPTPSNFRPPPRSSLA
jgi:rare lipoprotein A (peptidoglycan hydrolase)